MHRSQEKRRQYQEWTLRWRWPYTALMSFNLCVSLTEILQKRSQWPELRSLHALTRLGNPSSLEWASLRACLWSYILIQAWATVGEYRRELARAEQEKQYREAAAQEGVWPPLPNQPDA